MHLKELGHLNHEREGVYPWAVSNNRIFEYSIDGLNIRLVFSGSNIQIKNAASTKKILNLSFLTVISPHHPHYHVAQLPIGGLQISYIRSKSKSGYPVTILFENAPP